MPSLPVVVGPQGLQPQTPAALLAALIARVLGINPEATLNLPATLTEDISSTDVGALLICDSAVVETINSLTPFGANAFLLTQLGNVYGVPLGQQSNTSVFVQFTALGTGNAPAPGLTIGKGFLVSDGQFQYALSDGGTTASNGVTPLLEAVAISSGTWTVPAGTVTQLVSAAPPNITLTVVNPEPGTPGTDSETEASYRSRVLQAGLAVSIGMFSMLKTMASEVSGVQPRLISAIPQQGGGWIVMVGGGDPYLVAAAIYNSVADISTLVPSSQGITAISNANPGVVTLNLNHGFAVGQAFQIAGSNPSLYNGTYAALAIPALNEITLGTAYAANALTALSWVSTGGGEINATTTTAHGVTVGSTFVISGATPLGYNGSYTAIAGTTGSALVAALASNPGAATVLGQLKAGIANVNTTSDSPWVSGGVVTPNFRNVPTTIVDWPDTYVIPLVVPPEQTVTMTVTWNTTDPNFVSPAAVAQAGAQPLADYINSIAVGQPINLFRLQAVFEGAIANLIPPDLQTRLVFSVAIDGVGVAPEAGTGIIAGDPQSFLFAQASGISIVQG